MKHQLSLISGASSLSLVTVAQCKTDLRIQHTAEDTLIEHYIYAASDYCAEILGKRISNETWAFSLNPCDRNIQVPITPIDSITDVSILPAGYDGVTILEQSVNPDEFIVFNYSDSTVICLADDYDFPALADRPDAVQFTLNVGATLNLIGPSAPIARAIRLIVAHWYENRADTTIGTEAKSIPHGAMSLLGTLRTGWVG